MADRSSIMNWLSQYPEVTALIIVVAGWLIARLLRQLVATASPWLNKTFARLGARGKAQITPAFARALEFLAFWGVLLVSLLVALQVLGGAEFNSWSDRILTLTAKVLVALIIMAAGHLLGLLARSLAGRLSRGSESGLLPTLAYAAVITITAVTALEHVGLDISFARHIVLVILGVMLAGLALAFSLGARTLVANLVAQGELQRYQLGDQLQIDGISGKVVEIHNTGLVLSTDDGLATIPAYKFAESVVVQHPVKSDDDG